MKLKSIGAATVRDFVIGTEDWFDVDFAKYKFCLTPLTFLPPSRILTVVFWPRRIEFSRPYTEIGNKRVRGFFSVFRVP